MPDVFVIRRILVALDSSTSGADALEAAVELAERVEAELEGVFVEDMNLLRLAEHPVTHHVSLPTGLEGRLELAALEAEMRALAAEARRALAEAAERSHVRWSFRVVRDRVEAALAAAGGEADLLVLDTATRPISQYVSLVSGLRGAARRFPRSVLLVRGRPRPAGLVMVACEAARAPGKVLAAAAGLAATLKTAGVMVEHPRLAVVCLGTGRGEADQAKHDAREWLAAHGISARFVTLPRGSAAAFCQTVHEADAGLLVLDADSGLLDQPEVKRLMDEPGRSVLLVR